VRLFRESGAAESSESYWSVHDYIAALYIRDKVEQCLKQAGCAEPAGPFTVQAADELLRSFTVPDAEERLSSIRSDLPRDPWWWNRVPPIGPVAQDLQTP